MRFRQLMMAALAPALVGVASLRAQDPLGPATGDSVLRSLVAEALERNPTLAQRQAAVRAATLRIRPAGALPDPMLNTGVMDFTLPGFEFNRSDFTEVDAELMQEFPWPGTLRARTGVARATRVVAGADLETARRDATAAMGAAYYRLRYVVTALRTLAEQRRLLDAAVQLSTARYATGVAPQSDPLQAKLARDRLATEEVALQGDYVSALATVNALRDRPPSDAVPLAPLEPTALRRAVAPLPPADSLVALAVSAHPRLAGRRAMVEQAAEQIQVERLAGRPDFTLSARYGYRPVIAGTNLPDFFSIFLGIRLPIWATRKQHRLADAARADSSGAAAMLRDEEVRLAREVVETAARVEASRRRLELLVDGVVPAARATVESVLRNYQVGRTEFLTLLAVEDAWYRAALEAAEVGADYQTQLVMLRRLTAEDRP